MNVAILGCGPAGLAAAQAVRNEAKNAYISIISQKRPSPIYGAQYLHEPIPGISLATYVMVDYELRGTADQYREKVYGRSWDGQVSPEEYIEPHPAWDLRAAYRRLWSSWEHHIQDCEISANDIPSIKGQFDLVVSTIPANVLCDCLIYDIPPGSSHSFFDRIVWAAGDAPALGIKIPYAAPDYTVICNGLNEPSWYRISNVFGHITVEWPGEMKQKPPVHTCSLVRKPVATNCDCWLDGKFIRVGRYGAWDKKQLVHDAYNKTAERVKEIMS